MTQSFMSVPPSLFAAFSPDEFRSLGHAVVDVLANHLERAQARGVSPVMPRGTPTELSALFPSDFVDTGAAEPREALLQLIERTLTHSTALHSPRFVGHQVATPLPAAALCDLVSALTNNGMAVFEMGPAATAMERALIEYLARVVGFPQSSGGILTSGGSLGNLTALLAARQAKAGFDVWHQGLRTGARLCIMVADTAHYSVARAAHLLGLGDEGVVSVATDERLRLRPDALREAIVEAKARGKRPFCVVASAGSTAVGAIDPLEAVAQLCAEHALWFHVDGAHGASMLLSSKHRVALQGIERADSITWDAHKMMMMPALVTAVLFRDARHGAQAFAQKAGYLFNDDDSWADVSKRTVECTKRMMSLKLYACLKAYGTGMFAEQVERCCALAQALAQKAKARGRFQLLAEPECDIVVFRPLDGQGRPIDGGEVAALRQQLLRNGTFYLVQLHHTPKGEPNALWLRCTILNPLTTKSDLDALLDEIETALAENASPSQRSVPSQLR